METSSIIFLVVSASISFGLGRGIVYLRNKKRQSETEKVQQRRAQALREAPLAAEVKNKSKRKRQLVQINKLRKKD